LILDNCEHLLDSSAELSVDLLDACPRLHIVATSREAFGVPEETSYKVPALLTPEAEDFSAIDKLREIEAVQLFSERARAAAPDFQLDTGNALTVSVICRRLDGIPLALELAAARVKILTVEEIAARLDDRFRLLTGGGKSAVPHHQTLRALIDWSYEHLLNAEGLLFQRLSVFAGGWTLDAAEAVGSGDGIERWEVLDLLTRLLEKSLIEVDREGSRKIQKARYRMLETVKEYARDRLRESGREPGALRRHLEYSLSLAEEGDRGLAGADPTAWLRRLQLEHENLRVALASATQSAANADLGLRLMGVLSRYWFLSGHWNEARRLCDRLLEDPASRDEKTPPRAKVLNLAGNLAYWQGDYDRARHFHEQSLEIRRHLNDRIGISASLNNLGNVAERLGDYGEATAFYEESMAIRRELGDEAGIATALNNLGFVAEHRMEFARARACHEESLAIRRKMKDRSGEAMSLNNMGNVVYWLEDYEEARALQLKSLKINRELGDRWGMGWSLKDLARVAIKLHDYDAARSYLDEGLPLCREIGDRPGIAETLETIGMLETDLKRYRKAARLFAAAEALRAEIRVAHSPPGKRELNRYVEILRKQLGEKGLAAAQDEGRSTPIDAAIEDALGKGGDQDSRPGS